MHADDEDGNQLDEELIAIGALLRDVSDRLFYVYDFGDEWRHTVLLEAVHPAGFGEAPSCLAGRGAAPEEDSGGPNGWAHQQRGSAAAASFDIDGVNARLATRRELR